METIAMQKLFVEQTKYTPEISLDPQTRVFEFTGKSYPENTFLFYTPTLDWIKEYFEQKSEGKTQIRFEIIYFNSSSSKLFFDLFDLLEEASEDHEIEIIWLYDEENETALEAGEDFMEDFDTLNFNLVQK